ncbi:MazG-like family protein [Catenulispora sp. NL8]|uniref:MazG-like family protein n=1 Tax=Catenulispora pinistramenti TaxID=2705254 RepID=A0ABS5KQP1_9ACTN|nr:MazG-like family protein [Catenulispora pinistramenti]MBS2548363.1 MazG-like family protein [Catenulispora pinistramenti]
MTSDGTWDTIAQLTAWLDRDSPVPPDQALQVRILKITEETGEAAQALIGATGANPRKGHSHTMADVSKELCDVILTAMVALRTLTPDAQTTFAKHLANVADRSLTPR